MRIILILFMVSVLFMACAEKNKEEASAVEDIPVPLVPEDIPVIPVYDFDGLSEEYLTVTNDTTYVINFWATWCKPCVKELPAFEKIREVYENQPVKVVLVSLDFPENLLKRVIPFMESKGLKSEVVLLDDADANTWIPKVDPDWSGAIPATILLNKKNNKFYERSFSFEELEVELKTIL